MFIATIQSRYNLKTQMSTDMWTDIGKQWSTTQQ